LRTTSKLISQATAGAGSTAYQIAKVYLLFSSTIAFACPIITSLSAASNNPSTKPLIGEVRHG
jgi:hypothetical protein